MTSLMERLEARTVIQRGETTMLEMGDGLKPVSSGDTVQYRNPDGPEAAALIRELVEALKIFANARVDTVKGSIILGNVGAPAAVKNAKVVLAKAKASTNDR